MQEGNGSKKSEGTKISRRPMRKRRKKEFIRFKVKKKGNNIKTNKTKKMKRMIFHIPPRMTRQIVMQMTAILVRKWNRTGTTCLL